jgi:hypothetical protein
MNATMQLRITPYSTIADIQKQFNSCFPYLKLQFTSQHISSGSQHVKKTLLAGDTLLSNLTHVPLPTEINIDGNMTVSALEHYFEECAGLHVQIFRSSGSLWLITTATDQWSLNKQNSEGEELSQRDTVADEAQDLHEQE